MNSTLCAATLSQRSQIRRFYLLNKARSDAPLKKCFFVIFFATLFSFHPTQATELIWSFSPFTIGSGGSTTSGSGTFQWNSNTQALTAINLTVTYGGTTYTSFIPGVSDSLYLRLLTRNVVGDYGLYVDSTLFSNAGTYSNVPIGWGPCTGLNGGGAVQ